MDSSSVVMPREAVTGSTVRNEIEEFCDERVDLLKYDVIAKSTEGCSK